ncbi:MAG: right-handed parallel beta-helix repeat-containing protein [Paludibacteraceae bacterium]
MKTYYHTFLFTCVCVLFSFPLFAATYFAAPAGTGNGSSYASPCSLSTGISKLKSAGDTLYLLGGQYDLGNTKISSKNGNSTAYIVISGYPGETAILDFRTTAYGTRGLQVASNCTYLHIKDLTLRYSGKNNLYNEGSYCLFENLDIYGSADTGCQMKNGGNNIIKNVDSHDNFDYELDKSGNLTQCDFGGNADGFADKQHSGAPNHYIGCRSWNNSDDGWDFFQRVTTAETIIENCICYKNGPAYYDMRNHPRYETDKAWFDQFATPRTVMDADSNIVEVSLDRYPNMGNGNGFKIGGGYTDHKVLLHHCLAVANTVKGFDQNNNDGTMRVYNNTGYLNGYDFGFTTKYGTLSIQNCLSYKSLNGNATQSATTLVNSHNSWNISGLTVSASDFLSLDTTQILAARQADGSLAEGTLLHLAAGSALIDAGTDVGLFYTGAAPDLGCYETDGVLHPTITCTSGNSEQWLMEGEDISPIVFQWGGAATKLTCSNLPTGITYKISNTNKTLTLSGSIEQAGSYTVTVSTVSNEAEVNSLSATLHIKSSACKKVGFVTVPITGDAGVSPSVGAEDALILNKLHRSDSLAVTILDAAATDTDYSLYDVLILGAKPNSGAAAFEQLKGYDKPMLVLKPFLYKGSVWNWGTPANTQDVAVYVPDTTHTIFQNINFRGSNELVLFSQCNTNAVTAITDWTQEGICLASPVSQSTYTTIADMPAGTVVGETTLPQRLMTIGISEYSTAYLTNEALQVLENTVYYLLSMPLPQGPTQEVATAQLPHPAVRKVCTPQGIRLLIGDKTYDLLGREINN